MDVDQGATLNIIGGTGTLQRNVMSGNGADGIEIVHHTTTIGNQIVGNYIGTDLTGNAGPPIRATATTASTSTTAPRTRSSPTTSSATRARKAASSSKAWPPREP